MLTESEQIAALDRVVRSYEAKLGKPVPPCIKPALLDIDDWDGELDTATFLNTSWNPPCQSNEVLGNEKEVVYGLLWRQHPGHRLFALESTEWQDKYLCSCRQVIRFSKGVVEDALRYGNPR